MKQVTQRQSGYTCPSKLFWDGFSNYNFFQVYRAGDRIWKRKKMQQLRRVWSMRRRVCLNHRSHHPFRFTCVPSVEAIQILLCCGPSELHDSPLYRCASFGSIPETNIQGDNVFCDLINQQTQCSRGYQIFRAICMTSFSNIQPILADLPVKLHWTPLEWWFVVDLPPRLLLSVPKTGHLKQPMLDMSHVTRVSQICRTINIYCRWHTYKCFR